MVAPIPALIAQIAPDGNLSPRQKRRVLINMSLRRVRPGTGSSHEFMLRRTATIHWPDLRDILRGMAWMIVGGLATRAYMPEQVTGDLDILVQPSDEEQILAGLLTNGYQRRESFTGHKNTLVSSPGIVVDIIPGHVTWLDIALSETQRDVAGYPVIALPYLVLMKLASSRAQDVGDLSRMLGWADEVTLEQVRHVVTRYSPQDAEDLESLIFLGQQERLDPDNRLSP